MIKTEGTYFGQPIILACDECCHKAWGINGRPHIQLSEEDEDDWVWLADGELGEAPVDSDVYEGGEGKPQTADERLNKWCARECERSVMVAPGEPLKLPDFSQRIYNINRADSEN